MTLDVAVVWGPADQFQWEEGGNEAATEAVTGEEGRFAVG